MRREIDLGSGEAARSSSGLPGQYTLKYADGSTAKLEVGELPPPIEFSGAWDVASLPKDGGPEHVQFDKLISWSDHPDKGVKYYSGTASYTKKFTVPADEIAKDRRFLLDLGRVDVMAEVMLNGKSLGILWKTPFASMSLRDPPGRKHDLK